ncbi:MAG: hypothetical protein HYX67_11865 [Candidatus Melainabacteria bacterium]|nr:hypothetical protein [Candidatus Melainabacteria bacterium]
MGMNQYITRLVETDDSIENQEIDKAEVAKAVSEIVGMRWLDDDESSDYIEVFFKEQPGHGIDGVWETVFEFNPEGIGFPGRAVQDPNGPEWTAVRMLAERLQAYIIDEESNIYHPITAALWVTEKELEENGLPNFKNLPNAKT